VAAETRWRIGKPPRVRRPARPRQGPERERVRAAVLRVPAADARVEDHRLVRAARRRWRPWHLGRSHDGRDRVLPVRQPRAPVAV